MPNTATVTGKVGPGLTLTTQVYNNVTSLEFKPVEGTLRIVSDLGISYIDIYDDTTITYTVSSHVITVAVSA